MKSIYQAAAAVLGILSCLVVGCATPRTIPAVASTTTTADWKAGEYSVVFRAGPGSYEKSFSNYEVSRKFESLSYPSSIAVESAMLIQSLGTGSASNPGEHIKLFTSSSGKTLLIVENIPNDCCPCENWILIRGADDELFHDYLKTPSRAVKKTDDFEEYPKIIKVTENEITFRYSDGKTGSSLVKDLVKPEKRPTFPG